MSIPPHPLKFEFRDVLSLDGFSLVFSDLDENTSQHQGSALG